VQQRDLFGILAGANQIETEVGFVALLQEVERDQGPADEMSQDCTDNGVEQGGPE
jgi:hypothetical protein